VIYTTHKHNKKAVLVQRTPREAKADVYPREYGTVR